MATNWWCQIATINGVDRFTVNCGGGDRIERLAECYDAETMRLLVKTPKLLQALRVCLEASKRIPAENLQNTSGDVTDEMAGLLRYINRTCLEVLDPLAAATLPYQTAKVWIAWGYNACKEDAVPTEYDFQTSAELYAFLSGIDEAVGRRSYTQIDTEEELEAFIATKQETREEE